jgi:hypothetical protein
VSDDSLSRRLSQPLRYRPRDWLHRFAVARLGRRAVFGFLLSLPDALVTKVFAPILVIGSVGGVVIGGILHGWR